MIFTSRALEVAIEFGGCFNRYRTHLRSSFVAIVSCHEDKLVGIDSVEMTLRNSPKGTLLVLTETPSTREPQHDRNLLGLKIGQGVLDGGEVDRRSSISLTKPIS
jgi:hypothetical protein